MSEPLVVVELKKLTPAEITKYTSKKQKKQRKYKSKKKLRIEKNISVQKQESSIQSNEVIPSEMTIEQTVDENNGMDKSVQKQESSIQSNEVIPSELTIEQTVENNEMESIESVQKQESSIQSNEVIPSEMTIEQTVDENNGMDESVQKEETLIQSIKLIPCVNIKQEMHNNDYMMDNGTQFMDNMSNVSNDFDPNIVIKQEVEDEDHGYTTNYNDVEEEDDNMFEDSSNNFIPGIFNREMQNDNMGNYMHITSQGNMFGQSNNFISNFNYGQEHNVVNMRMVLPHYMYNTNGEILPVAFHNNDNEWINHAQGHMYDPSNHLIPNIIHRPGCFHNNDYVGNNISQANHNMPGTSYDLAPVRIKQENHNYDDMNNIAQGDMYDPSNNLIPNIVHGQGFQNNDYVGNNILYQNGYIPSSLNGYVPYIPIKQEVLEE
ncbi:hypothetical protein AGLY_009328 [Aphis glycines]|uniref:Uncharacterized protein n=1 Tax=Aphis glycines TaxID=307491 RepID=A0A6G0TIY7_APHGL|nr:hypothetical protein AGLY_009328 [Aphis glycines]